MKNWNLPRIGATLFAAIALAFLAPLAFSRPDAVSKGHQCQCGPDCQCGENCTCNEERVFGYVDEPVDDDPPPKPTPKKAEQAGVPVVRYASGGCQGGFGGQSSGGCQGFTAGQQAVGFGSGGLLGGRRDRVHDRREARYERRHPQSSCQVEQVQSAPATSFSAPPQTPAPPLAVGVPPRQTATQVVTGWHQVCRGPGDCNHWEPIYGWAQR